MDHIKKWGGEATFVQADISKASDVEKMINLAEKAYHLQYLLIEWQLTNKIWESECDFQ